MKLEKAIDQLGMAKKSANKKDEKKPSDDKKAAEDKKSGDKKASDSKKPPKKEAEEGLNILFREPEAPESKSAEVKKESDKP
mmetsp:Transcript_28541/g.43163  ORF Transcript_28541/g.43163 Transcript_28541/m.43163 type:complete len:82 (+) Transcript_28541:8351-8596(+)